MSDKQIYNPYLPLDKCIPDGEPHVFGDRVYLYGSHDEEGGSRFCALDYEVFSAPVEDLTNWRSEGISYRASQDPDYSDTYHEMYAPDVVQGTDGRFYLYYAMAGGCFTGPIHVAVSNSPAGPFDYYGCVKNSDGSVYTRHVTFDPAVMNDNGKIWMYYGWSLAVDPTILENFSDGIGDRLRQAEMQLFGKSADELQETPEGVMGANVVELESDMLTIKGYPKRIVPGQFDAGGTSFEGHAFFEASSIRKIRNTYYFIYSSQWQHELCYATSSRPDSNFTFGGVIISNGDIGFQGRSAKDRVAMTGNNHGSMELINGEWYIFYHRQTHKTSFSRQGCAEKISILQDGSIPQVEMTSCGLNNSPLAVSGRYNATIACNLTNGNMPHVEQTPLEDTVPYITHQADEHFITDITNGTIIGYKYFKFTGPTVLSLCIRGDAVGYFELFTDEEMLGSVSVRTEKEWEMSSVSISAVGVQALFLKYHGEGMVQLKEIVFS